MELNAEQRIVLDRFQPRWYQDEIWDAIENTSHKRKVLAILPRRSGKDICAWNLAIRQCLRKTCMVYYALPTFSQARRCIWDAISIDGQKFIDFIPKELIKSVNSAEMKIIFKNDSLLQCIGADTYDTSLVGTNPYAVILSEYALMNPDVFAFVRPILAANGGWCLLLTTPRGKNHAWHLYKIAQELDDWHVIKMGVTDTQHIPPDVLDQERAQMDPGLFEQEYECSFERGIEGSYYGKHLDALRLKGQITSVPWESGLLVHVALDIGVNDATTLIWFQVVGDGSVIRIIDCYSNTGLGLDHYAKILQDKPYRYGKYFAPHDIKVREWGGGAISRFEKARQLGLDFTLIEQVPIIDGIENVWMHFPKFWIDQDKCRSLINALENYRKEWDEQKSIYRNKPLHNWASNYADALRYMCMSLHKTKRGLTSEEFDRERAKALYGPQQDLPRFFRQDPRYDNYRPF